MGYKIPPGVGWRDQRLPAIRRVAPSIAVMRPRDRAAAFGIDTVVIRRCNLVRRLPHMPSTGLLPSGRLKQPILDADTGVGEGGRITAVGRAADCDTDARAS